MRSFAEASELERRMRLQFRQFDRFVRSHTKQERYDFQLIANS